MKQSAFQKVCDTAGEVLYRALLRLYPASYRREFGRPMLQVFRDLQRRRTQARLTFWMREWGGLASTALREWTDRLRPAPPIRPRRVLNKGRLLMQSIRQDIQYSLRGFLNRPLFTLVVVLTIALGIGANTAIFSLVNGVLLKPLPYPDSERIVTVWEDFSAQGGPEQEWIEVPNFFIWKEQNTVFDTLAAFGGNTVNLTGGDQPEQLAMSTVSYGFLRTFGAEPTVGRGFLPEDDKPGAQQVVILSNHLWQRRFGADPALVGQSLQLNGRPYLVIGVLPAGFQFSQLGPVDLWTPLRFNANSAGRENFFLRAVGRLKPGVPLQRADSEMDAIMGRIGQAHPENRGTTIRLIPLLDLVVQPAETALWLLMAAVSFVLLIGCANIANLMLGRASSRRREIAIRAALGAGRRRLVRQLLTESVLMSLGGGAMGLLVGYWGLDALLALAPATTPRLDEVSLDSRVLIFTLAVSLLTGVLFGIVPALQTSRTDVAGSLREGGRDPQSESGRSRVRGLLVTAEVALALLLLVGSGLLIRSFNRLLQVDLGFNPSHLYSATLNLPRDRYPERQQKVQFMDELLNGLRARPGIESAAAVSVLPLAGNDTDTSFTVEGRPAPVRREDIPIAWYRRVTAGYFETMGIPVLEGREFSPRDHLEAPRVVVVSQVTAQRFWPEGGAVGKRIRFGDSQDSPWVTVIGVVPGVRHNSLNQSPRAEMYLPYSQYPGPNMNLVMRSSNSSDSLAAMLRAEIAALDKEMPFSSLVQMDDLVDSSIAQPRFFMALTAGFSALALILAVVGIYGVLSYTVSRRRGEMGIRMALGAGRGDVLLMVVRQGVVWTALGILIGLPASLGLSRLMSGLLFEVSPTDGATFLLVTLALALVAVAACLLPALRATRIDPLQALRYE